jgi:ABC-type phosphate transport system auxiliary subunit
LVDQEWVWLQVAEKLDAMDDEVRQQTVTMDKMDGQLNTAITIGDTVPHHQPRRCRD